MVRSHAVLLFAAALLSAKVSAAPPPATLVSKVIDTYGGETAWKNVAAIRQSGKVSSAMKGEGKLVREWVRPDKLRITIDYPSGRERRVVNGLTGSRDDMPVSGPQLDAMILQSARIGLPALLIGHRQDLRALEPRERDGQTLDVIEIPLTTYMSIEIEIDRPTGHIARSIGRAAVPGSNARLEFIAIYDDYRKADGLLFAFHEENFASGFKTGMTTLEKVEVVTSPVAGAKP